MYLCALVQVSWSSKVQPVVLGPSDVKLPRLQVQDCVGDVQRLHVRFSGHPKDWPGAAQVRGGN